MKVVGICRFSLLGRGDWRAYRGKSEEEISGIIDAQKEIIFDPARLESRLKTLEHVTLASISGQTNKDFIFLVLASEMIPDPYKSRLVKICNSVPQVILNFYPVTSVASAQNQAFKDLGLKYREVLQFRLDDDDALSKNFTEQVSLFGNSLGKQSLPFSISFRDVIFLHAQTGKAYSREMPFLGAGTVLRHRYSSIFSFGHFALGKRFPSLILPDCSSLILKHETNDTAFNQSKLVPDSISRDALIKRLSDQFPFFDSDSLSVLGLKSIFPQGN